MKLSKRMVILIRKYMIGKPPVCHCSLQVVMVVFEKN